jgi:hypothetical protein
LPRCGRASPLTPGGGEEAEGCDGPHRNGTGHAQDVMLKKVEFSRGGEAAVALASDSSLYVASNLDDPKCYALCKIPGAGRSRWVPLSALPSLTDSSPLAGADTDHSEDSVTAFAIWSCDRGVEVRLPYACLGWRRVASPLAFAQRPPSLLPSPLSWQVLAAAHQTLYAVTRKNVLPVDRGITAYLRHQHQPTRPCASGLERATEDGHPCGRSVLQGRPGGLLPRQRQRICGFGRFQGAHPPPSSARWAKLLFEY